MFTKYPAVWFRSSALGVGLLALLFAAGSTAPGRSWADLGKEQASDALDPEALAWVDAVIGQLDLWQAVT